MFQNNYSGTLISLFFEPPDNLNNFTPDFTNSPFSFPLEVPKIGIPLRFRNDNRFNRGKNCERFCFTEVWVRLYNTHVSGHFVIFSGNKVTAPQARRCPYAYVRTIRMMVHEKNRRIHSRLGFLRYYSCYSESKSSRVFEQRDGTLSLTLILKRMHMASRHLFARCSKTTKCVSCCVPNQFWWSATLFLC